MLKLIHAFDMNAESVQKYYNSFEDKLEELNSYTISLINKDNKEYFNYILNWDQNLYYLVNDKNPGYIIGFGSIEASGVLNYHKDYLNVGNISYGIHPSERKKGYGTLLLKLLLKKCEELGMHEVCVSCHEDNIGSYKVIANNNGKYEKHFYDEDNDKQGLKFWIKLHPGLKNRTKRCVKRIKETIDDYIS